MALIFTVVSSGPLVGEPAAPPVGKVSFTFDCAQWGDNGLDHILDVLKRRKIRATFFVTGKFIETNNPGLLKIVEAGHEVANHSYEHDKNNSIAECNRVAALFKEATGKTMAPYFRAPYLHETGINWTEYSNKGWAEGYVSLITCDALPEYKIISDRVFLNNFRLYVINGSDERVAIHKTAVQKGPGHINGAAILMHIDGYRFHLLESMVDIVERGGYQCATFSEVSAGRAAGNPFLDSKPGVIPPVSMTSLSKPLQIDHLTQGEARPDPEKMAVARKSFADYLSETGSAPRGEFSFTFNCHDYHRHGLGTILVALKKNRAQGTFYISESYLEQVPGAVKYILEYGHEVAFFAAGNEGTKSFADASRFANHFKEETGEDLVHLFRSPDPESEAVENNFAISSWVQGYQSIIACDTEDEWKRVGDGSYLAYFKIYLSVAPKQQVSIMKVPLSGTANIDGGVIALHPNGNRYHLLDAMIKSVRDKGYSIVPQSALKTKRIGKSTNEP